VLKIGIQGALASFHDQAVHRFFSTFPDLKFQVVENTSFRGMCEVLQSRRTDVCLMAIENTIAGSILPNYMLLEKFGFKIMGEVYLRIEMSLMALPGQAISDLKFIQSHPMALHQCSDFLFQYQQITPLEGTDTAGSAREIADKKLAGYGAIASSFAAERYGLQVLAQGIENNQQNFTRFLVIRRDDETSIVKQFEDPSETLNKASIRFITAHRPGSLADALEVFKRYQINLAKIQSIPIQGKPYHYSIHLDVEWQDRPSYEQAMKELESQTEDVRRFGEYKRGDRPFL
jgi:prephenate dehydratase